MHFSAKRGIEIACRPSVRDVGGSVPHRLEILETNCTNNLPNTFALRSPKVIHPLPGEHGEIWGKGSVGVSRDCPFFSGTPYYLRNGKSYGFHIWPVHSEAPCEQKPLKNFGEKGAWAYSGTAQFFRVLSQEREKLLISNLPSTLRGSIRIKVH